MNIGPVRYSLRTRLPLGRLFRKNTLTSNLQLSSFERLMLFIQLTFGNLCEQNTLPF